MSVRQVVIPGDHIEVESQKNRSSITLGPHISLVPTIGTHTLNPTTVGLLEEKHLSAKRTVYYVEANSKRYLPESGDNVIGVIIGSFGDFYRVSLNDFSVPVVLNQFSFPNASKKNRPRLEVGDLIYARVESVNPNVDAEISCVDPTTGKAEGYGKLEGGMVFKVKLAYARNLLFDPNAHILTELVTKCKFEIAIGVNGKIWLKTDDIHSTVACGRCIEKSQQWSDADIKANVEDAFAAMKKSKDEGDN
ncbi:RRP40 [Brettanomyces bruxellensis]|uniref:DEBR0S2_19086g1_1 n=1 Tax=Dekkera bruxellensis TaxID=5007 RepID=A0A7D9CYM9_DEKBR|nr:RRP40 [Brettanomyces bruxellensis]